MAAIVAEYAATRVALPQYPCTVPTAAFLHHWNTAAGRVHSDVSLATYLAIAGGSVAAVGMLIARPGARMFIFLAPYTALMTLLILYGNALINTACGI